MTVTFAHRFFMASFAIGYPREHEDITQSTACVLLAGVMIGHFMACSELSTIRAGAALVG